MIFRTALFIFFIFCSLSYATAGDDEFRDSINELVEKAGDTPALAGKDGWYFLAEELRHVAAGVFWGEKAVSVSLAKPEYADPLPSVLDFNDQLNKQGIKLILAVIPPKAVIYPEMLNIEQTETSVDELNRVYEEFYKILTDAGIIVLDLASILDAAKKEGKVYCQTDTHYSGLGLRLTADQIANIIKAMNWYEKIPKNFYTIETRDMKIRGDLIEMLNKPEEKTETISLSFVRNKENEQPAGTDLKSPVLLLGDSHTLVFSVGGDLHASGAGLPDLLAHELGFPVDLLGVRGSGVTPARIKLFQRIRKNSDYLKDKKIVVWCFSAREFTGSGGWRNIPLVR